MAANESTSQVSPSSPSHFWIPSQISRAASNNDIGEVLLYMQELTAHDRKHLRDASGRTLVHLACCCQTIALLAETVDRLGLPVNVCDYNGDYPLHLAARHSFSGHVQFLLRRGSSTMWLNGRLETPLDIADQNLHDEIIGDILGTGVTREALQHTKDTLLMTQRLVEPGIDVQRCWKEVEAMVRFNLSVPLRALPWPDLPQVSDKRCWFCVVPNKPKLIAGMLFLADTYQFEGTSFKLVSESQSPHGTGTEVIVYESISSDDHEHAIVECLTAKQKAAPTLIRCYLIPPDGVVNALTGRQTVIHAEPPRPFYDAKEENFLVHQVIGVREAILSHKAKQLELAVTIVVRSFTRWKTLRKFRTVMLQLVTRILIVKRFLLRVMRQKRLATAMMTLYLSMFKRYCIRELRRVKSGIFPAILDTLAALTSRNMLSVVTRCMTSAKLRTWQANHGQLASAFTYSVSLEELCVGIVEEVRISAVASALQKRGTFLPRQAMLSLQRQSAALSSETLARRRLLSLMKALAICFKKQTSYASMVLADIEDAEKRELALFDERKRELQEQRAKAAVAAQVTARLSGPATRQFRGDRFAKGKDSSAVGKDSSLQSHLFEEEPDASDPVVYGEIRPIGETLASLIHRPVPPPSTQATSTSKLFASSNGVQLSAGHLQPQFADRRQSAGSASNAGRRSIASSSEVASVAPPSNRCSLVCDDRSPIPNVVGNKHLIKRLLVPNTGKDATPKRSRDSSAPEERCTNVTSAPLGEFLDDDSVDDDEDL